MGKNIHVICFLLCGTITLCAQPSARMRIAVNDLTGKGIDKSTAEICSDRLRNELVLTGVFRVIERGEMESVLKEQGFQQSGACDDQACLVEMGQLLGVERMVAGSIGKIGDFYTISLRAVDVATGEILTVVNEDFTGQVHELISRAVGKAARKLAGGTASNSGDTEWMPSGGNTSRIFAGPTVTDADGNVYTSIVIGTQTWTVENLRTTKYNDGSAIPHVTDGTQWSNLTTPGYCFFQNTSKTADQTKYGALYNWLTVKTGKLAPAGWHVPTDAEWTTLENYLIANGYNWDGSTSGNKIGKSLAAATDWFSSITAGDVGNDLSSNNSTGFSALPGGYRTNGGNFYYQSYGGFWWSATEGGDTHAYHRDLDCGIDDLDKSNYIKKYGFSVRLARD